MATARFLYLSLSANRGRFIQARALSIDNILLLGDFKSRISVDIMCCVKDILQSYLYEDSFVLDFTHSFELNINR